MILSICSGVSVEMKDRSSSLAVMAGSFRSGAGTELFE